MKYLTFLSRLFGSRIFLMFAMFFLFIGVALENIMRSVSFHFDATPTGMFFLMIPVSILLLLVSAFLIVMKRRWADFPAIALLSLALLLHRPFFRFEYMRTDWSLMSSISEAPFNYFFYLACIFLIVFLVVQIKNNKYRISLK
jgi:uncharacterized membrane protein